MHKMSDIRITCTRFPPSAQSHSHPPNESLPDPQVESVLNHAPTVAKLQAAAKRHGLSGVGADAFEYSSQAVQTHMASLLKSMTRGACQRSDPSK